MIRCSYKFSFFKGKKLNNENKIDNNNFEEKIEIFYDENKKREFSKRKSKIENIKNNNLKLNNFFTENDFLIEEEEIEDSYSNKSINDENLNDFSSENYEKDFYEDDEEFLYLKNKNLFNFYYSNFATNSFKQFLDNINEFQMFDLALKDIKLSNENLYNNFINSLNQIQKNNIENFRNYQKIAFKNNTNTDFIYRKILKIKK